MTTWNLGAVFYHSPYSVLLLSFWVFEVLEAFFFNKK